MIFMRYPHLQLKTTILSMTQSTHGKIVEAILKLLGAKEYGKELQTRLDVGSKEILQIVILALEYLINEHED